MAELNTMLSTWQLVRWQFVVATFVALSICAPNGCYADYWNNVTPDDADYPLENKRPNHNMTLTILGTISPTLDVQLEMVWRAEGIDGCRYTLNKFEGVYPALSMRELLPFVKTGDNYEATVQLDKYEPGRCHWHLSEILTTSKNQRGVDNKRNSTSFFNIIDTG
ncbi:hypothetical protein [Sulfurisoma sediminicola]|uniref:hypothetical protein n=1 Tax=Sulfurisoma sediminicola TaxID=1381557 RepID=UPI000F615CCF|nr:hypothetical protein [Sulfurisoma sediminicola]